MPRLSASVIGFSPKKIPHTARMNDVPSIVPLLAPFSVTLVP